MIFQKRRKNNNIFQKGLFIIQKEAIKEYLKSIEPYVNERGGFIPHVDHRCPPDVDEEDYLYYLDLKEELFGMDKFDKS